jgi:enoyl-[acyl-carrier protein] reductase I
VIPLDLSGKTALVTGVGDNVGFAWYIAKALQAAGARLVFACHPRLVNIVESILKSDKPDDAASRVLPFNRGTLKPEKVLACDVGYDTIADVPEEVRTDRRFARHGDFTIQGMVNGLKEAGFASVDILIHAIAFTPEIKNLMLNTSRGAYTTALCVSAYSLTALCRALLPLMENRPDGASVLGLTYLGGDRVVGHYGGGMSTAKAALQIDAKQLANNLGKKNIRVNLISAGPYASRAARAIGDIDKMAKYAAAVSPIRQPITPDEVANVTAFLCSPLSAGITGSVIYVDNGYNIMGVPPDDLEETLKGSM